MSHRHGVVSLPELVLVFWLFGFVLLALAGFVTRQNRLAAGQRDVVRFQEARRTIVLVLGTEVRALTTGDVHADGTDAIRLRAVRGVGTLCGTSGAAIEVRYAGTRWPDPEKDSVLIVGLHGEDVRRVAHVTSSTACAGATLRIGVEPPVPPARGVALVFESGRYDVAQDGLRYRLGLGGRQPLTEAVFAPGSIRPGKGPHGWLLELPLHRDSLAAAPRRLRASLPMLAPADEVDPG